MDPGYLAKLEQARSNISRLLNVLQTPPMQTPHNAARPAAGNRAEENGNLPPQDDYQVMQKLGHFIIVDFLHIYSKRFYFLLLTPSSYVGEIETAF